MRNVPAKQQAAVSAKINAIRAAHGNPGTSCPTCARRACDPFRRVDSRGYVVEGCVDAYHHDAFGYSCSSSMWHTRPEAHAIRAAELAHLKAL